MLEHVFRATERMSSPPSRRLAAQLADTVSQVPALLAQAASGSRTAADVEAALLTTEALLLTAGRLGYCTEPDLAVSLERVAALLAPAPPEAATAPAAVVVEVPPTDASPSAGEPSAVAPPTVDAAAAPVVPPAPPARAEKPVRPRQSYAAEVEAPPPLVRSRPGASAAPAPERARPVDHLVVDGSNFLGRAPGFSLGSDASRDQLLFRLQEFARRHPAHHVIVFFDGQHVAAQFVGGVEVRVTGGRRPADDVIVDYLHELPEIDRPRTVLVTDDREFGRRARSENVTVESVAWLHGKLLRRPDGAAEDAARPAGTGKGQLDDWMEFFNKPPKRPGR